MAAKKPVSAEDFYDISLVGDPQVHPKGTWVAFVHETPQREGKDYIRSIWLKNKSKGKPKQFTSGGKSGDHSPRWSPDGKQLAFVSQRNGKPQIFLIALNGGEAQPLTSHPNGAGNPVWSPDGKFIAYVSRTRDEERQEEDAPKKQKHLNEREAKRLADDRSYEEQMRMDPKIYTRTLFRQGTIYKDDRNTHIYIHKISGGKPKRITNGCFDFMNPAWTPDGKFIIASTKQTGDVDIDIRTDLVKIPVEGGDPMFVTANPHADYAPQVSPCGKWIYYMCFQAEDLPRQRMILQRVPVQGGAVEKLTESFDYDPHSMQLSPDGAQLFFGASKEGAERIFSMPSQGGKITEIIAGKFMAAEFHIAGNTLAFRYESPEVPSDIFTTDLTGKNLTRLTEINKKFLSKRSLSIPEEVWYTRPDGFKIQGWTMRPHGYEPGKKYPWIVEVHGGPHVMWGYSFWHEFQSMCGQGYGVFFCNPRGSDGYGGDFKKAIHLAWGEEDSQDILAGADLMVSQGLADPDRLYLTGGSFGGFMTAWLVGHDHRFKAAVAQRGVYNMISMYGASDANTLIEWEFDTVPWENFQLLWDRSPLKYVKNVQTPLMIIHSENDFRAGAPTADEMYTALRRLGKEAEYVRYPREGHELSRSGEPKHRVDRINRMIGWFNRHP